MYTLRLPHGVATVNLEIVASHVGAGIASQVNVGALELLGLTVAAHGDHGQPEVLGILVDKVRQTGVDVAGGDAVDAGKVAPLIREGTRHVDTARLGDVVGALFLGVVDDVTGHGGGDDEVASAALLEVGASSLGAVENARQVGLDDLVPVVDGAVQETAARRSARIGDEAVDLAKVLDHVLDELLHALPAANVALVSLGLYAVLLLQCLGVLLAALWARGVGDGDVGAHLGTAASSFDAHSAVTGGTGDGDDSALEAQELKQTVGFGNGDRHYEWKTVGFVLRWRRARGKYGW